MEDDRQASEAIKANLGTYVELELVCELENERMSFNIVPDKSADYGHGFLGVGTPLAQAILGRIAGQVVPYRTGDVREIKILSVLPSSQTPPSNTAAKREATIQKAVEQADRTSAMIFASSFSGKWGDYDPDGITDEW